jgi:hypothetical protein
MIYEVENAAHFDVLKSLSDVSHWDHQVALFNFSN